MSGGQHEILMSLYLTYRSYDVSYVNYIVDVIHDDILITGLC